MKFLNRFNIRLPIIQAPMAGGIVTSEMIAAVCAAGGIGSLPLGYLKKEEARQAIKKVKLTTQGVFSVNVFILSPKYDLNHSKVQSMLAHINHYQRELGLPEIQHPPSLIETPAEELIDIAVEEQVTVISFTFGTLSPKKIEELHHKGITIIGTATTVKEGLVLESIGCDAVIAQGYEAGGHRGGFIEQETEGLIGTMALIPQMVDALNIPVIAAGGIMDGRGITAALALGAQGVQMGTAFLSTLESNASVLHKKMLQHHTENDTCITTAYTGKSVRAFKNKYITETEAKFSLTDILPYPIQHQLTQDLRKKSGLDGNENYAGYWCGQGIRLGRVLSIAELMKQFEDEMNSSVLKLEITVLQHTGKKSTI